MHRSWPKEGRDFSLSQTAVIISVNFSYTAKTIPPLSCYVSTYSRSESLRRAHHQTSQSRCRSAPKPRDALLPYNLNETVEATPIPTLCPCRLHPRFDVVERHRRVCLFSQCHHRDSEGDRLTNSNQSRHSPQSKRRGAPQLTVRRLCVHESDGLKVGIRREPDSRVCTLFHDLDAGVSR